MYSVMRDSFLSFAEEAYHPPPSFYYKLFRQNGKAIVSPVLLQEEAVGHVASAYINNIYVNEDVMPATHVREHLARFGLECKDPE